MSRSPLPLPARSLLLSLFSVLFSGPVLGLVPGCQAPVPPAPLDAQPADDCGGCDPGLLCEPGVGCLDCGPGMSCPAAILYAAPNGQDGGDCTYSAPCTLGGARDKARPLAAHLTSDLLIFLRGGTYGPSATATPFHLSAADSGSNGHSVIYRALPGQTPILSGGTAVTGPWALDDPNRGIYRAAVPTTAVSRQLFVNGVRAIRARGPDLPVGFTKTTGGYTTADTTLAGYGNPGDIEIVAFNQWKSFRCGIASIVGQNITMKQPCWQNAQSQPGYTMDLPQWVENARELLDSPGEFYLDTVAHDLYYKPRPGEDLATASVILPTQQTLLSVDGTLDAPVHDVQLDGLTFSYATWLRPSDDDGYADLQASITLIGLPASEQKTPAHVALTTAHDFLITGCTFTHLGAAGISLDTGSQNNTLLGNRFEDLSAGAITLGNVTQVSDHHPTDARLIIKGNTVSDNFITRTSLEYHDATGIFAGYTQFSVIQHNDLFDLPYTGISAGWGWGSVDVGGGTYTTPTVAHDNTIADNVIAYHMRRLIDGGGVYVLGAQGNSTISGNYVNNQGDPYGALYLDNGTQYFTVTGDVVDHAPYWLLVQPGKPVAKNNVVTGNFSDQDNVFDPTGIDPSNTLANNTVTPSGGSWPAAAQSVIAGAGLETAYQSLHPPEVAQGKPATASSVFDVGHVAALGNDGDGTTGWSPTNADPLPYWQVDLGAVQNVRRVEIVTRWDLDQEVTRRNFAVWGSSDASFATHQVLGSQGAQALPYHAIWVGEVAGGGAKVRYIRVTKTVAEYFFLGEVRVLALQ